ncbi:hypothetical protein [Microbacterium sp. cx-59]|uniref:hypothetical protein n=1 Tax=Microbacterium sp. cx-59 TaxID=2891207 RepID=UPI001E4042C4|nr:hypothetical protein [Microbacterium sp. cx-59]MCC4907772.1 hypothetical protein [Microbacterium sp. cx-59]
MARLPKVGGDKGDWGEILNDFLKQAHDDDGALKVGSVGASQLTSSAVMTTAIGDGQVTTVKLADASVGAHQIADAAITEAKLSPEVMTLIGTGVIADDSIDEVKLGIDVRKKLNAELADASVTTAKLAGGAVTTGRIEDGAVTNEKITDGAVSESKLSSEVQGKLNGDVPDDSISTAKIADGAVTPNKISGLGAIGGIASLDLEGRLPDGQVPSRLTATSLNRAFVGEGAPVFHSVVHGVSVGPPATASANTSALSALLSSAPSGAIIQFPPGTIYLTDITLAPGKIVHLRGAGRSVTSLRRPSGVSGDFITINSASSTISDLTVEGGRYQNASSPDMDNICVNAPYVNLQRLGVNKASGSGIVLGKAGPAIVGFYSDIQFRENRGYHIRTIAGSDSTDGMWVNIEGGYSGRSGVRLDLGSQNMLNVHMWASGMEDVSDNHGVWINSTNNTLTNLQCETNNGEGIYVTSNRNVLGIIRSWGNVKRGLYLTGTANSFTGGTFERNNVGNTATAVSDAFAQIVLSGATRNTLVGLVTIDSTSTIGSANPSSNGSPSATYPFPGKSVASFTAAFALREESGADYNNFTGCRFHDEYTLSGTNPAYSFAPGVGHNDAFSAVDFGATAPPTQTVVSGVVRIPSFSDVVQVNAGSTITSVIGQRVGRRATIIFTGSGTGSVTDNGTSLKLASDFLPTPGSTLSLVSDGTNWYETGRSS